MSMNQKYDILVEFDDVHVDAVAKRTIRVHELPKSFTIRRFAPYQHMKLPVFHLKKRKSNPDTLECFYRPTVSFSNHVGYFHLIDDGKIEMVVCMKGNCIGPMVQLSTKYVGFYKLPNRKRTERTLEMINDSPVPTRFQIVVDNANSVFTCEPFFGELPPNEHLYVKIHFNPKKHGTYYFQIHCLLENQDPLIIEAHGIYGVADNARRDTLLKYTPVNFKNGYETYMTDVVYDKNQNPILSIGDKDLNFGNVYRPDFAPVLTSRIHNISDTCIIVQFDDDADAAVKTFELDRASWQMFPGEIVKIGVKFTPPNDGAFYSSTLYARAFLFKGLEEAETIKRGGISFFPISFRIHATGNAFPRNYSWIPQVQNPDTVTLPLTVPGHPVYNTFTIESKSDFPTVFRITPSPAVTDPFYSVEPRQGEIHGRFQTFVVKFDPKHIDENCIVTEEWAIVYNDSMDRRKITFEAAVELPQITFDEDGTIDFGLIYPGCRKKKIVTVMNGTGHNYKFEFVKLYEVGAEPATGRIDACAAVPVTFSYKAVDSTFCLRTLECEFVRLLSHDLLCGEPSVFTLQVAGFTAYGKLCGSPLSCDLGSIECFEEATTKFTLFNYGQSDIHYKLVYVTNDDVGMQDPRWITATPEVGTVVSGGEVEVAVKIRPADSGTFKGCFRYLIRVLDDSDEIVDNKNPIWPDGGPIFEMKYVCFYPTLQFAAIVDNTCGPLFGKIDLWEMLKINRLNNLLATMKRDEIEVHYLRMPDAEHGLNIKKHIVLVLENTNDLPTFCKIVREKCCDCELQERKISMSRTEKVYNCPHRALLNFKIEDEVILAKSYEYVTIDLSYEMEGLQTVCFRMLLSQNRSINLVFKMMGLKADGSVLSRYTWNLKFVMRDVYVNIKRPGLQAYWFYNNTRQPAQYEFETAVLDELNQKYGKMVFECIDPQGWIEPKTYCPIYFKFDPVNLKQFDIMLPMKYASGYYLLNLICKGVPYFYSPIGDLSGQTLDTKEYHYPHATVELSQENFVIGPILTFTRVTRLFFMKNVNKNHTIGFSFEEIKKQGILELSVCPPRGLLKPRESLSCILKICAFRYPSSTRTLLNCYFVDYTQLEKHIRSKENFTKMGLHLQHEFTIGDGDSKKNGAAMEQSHVTTQILAPPKIFQVGLNITVDISSVADRDTKISLNDQVSITSYREMSLYRRCQLERLIPDANYRDEIITSTLTDYNKKVTKLLRIKMKRKRPKQPRCNDCEDRKELKTLLKDEECFVHVHTAMEGLIGELLQSDIFQYLITEIFKLPPLYYAQFKHDPGSKVRMLEVREILNMPPTWLLSMIMEKIILDCLLKHFNFDNIITPAHVNFRFESDREEPSIRTSTFGIPGDLTRDNLLKSIYTERFMFFLDNL